MGLFHFALTHLSLLLGGLLITIGWTGIISGTAFIHRSPLGLHRPLVYILAASLVFFEQLQRGLGPNAAQFIVFIIGAALVYETGRLLLVPTVAVTGASAELLDADIRDAFTKLHVQYKGRYPRYTTTEPEAEFEVKFSKLLGQGDISVSPSSQRPLLRKIEDIIDNDFSHEEERNANRGFIWDIIEGVSLCGIAIWQLMRYA
ncbi:MAG: hypothetical protein RL326_324 [Pseudomonadota bacterium]|jgi:hypothetical protein